MTVNPVPSGAPYLADDAHSRLAQWAVGIAAVVTVVVVVAYAILGIAFAVGGDDAISDNWVGYLAAFALLGGLAGSLVAFALAVVSKVRHEEWTLLWWPLALFPVLALATVLVEVVWME